MGRWLPRLVWMAAAWATAAVAAAPERPLVLVQLPPDVALRGSEERLRAVLGQRVVDGARTRVILDEAGALGLRCATLDEQCAAGFGQLAGVSEVIAVVVSARGGGFVATATRVEARSARVLDVSVGRLAVSPDDGGRPLDVIVTNLWTSPPVPVVIPVEVIGAVGGIGTTAVVVDGRPGVPTDQVLWLLPGPHVISVAGGASTRIEVTSRGTPQAVTLPADGVIVTAPSSVAARVARPPATTDAATTVAPPSHWGLVAMGGTSAVLLGGVAMLGAEAWLAAEAASPGRLSGAERILGQGLGAAGAVVVGVGVVGAVSGTLLWWSGP